MTPTPLFLMLGMLAANPAPKVFLFNNAGVDLEVVADRVVVEILPGQGKEFEPHSEQWIHFGIVAHLYSFAFVDWRRLMEASPVKPVRLQAESDGGIYFAGDAPFPANISAKQPDGFPLRPTSEIDLTGMEWAPGGAEENEKLWLAEAEKRFRELRDGVVRGVPAREVFARLRAKLAL